MMVRLLAQMHIVEMRRILVAEHETNVPVAVVLMRAQYVRIQHEVTDVDIFQQRDVVRTTMRRFVLAALLELAVDMPLVSRFDLPSLRVRRLPVLWTILERFLEHHGQRILGRHLASNYQAETCDEHNAGASVHFDHSYLIESI